MYNLTLYWVWLLVSIVGLTWFWHRWVFGMLIFLVIVFLLVKKMWSWIWLWCLLVWSCMGAASVLNSFSPKTLTQHSNLEPWQSIQVQMVKRLKPDVMQASLIVWWVLTSTTILIQSDDLNYTPWAIVQLIIWNITTPSFPRLSPIFSQPTRHPSIFEYSRWLAMKWIDWHIQTSSHIQLPDWLQKHSFIIDWKGTVSQRLQENISSKYTSRTAWLLEWMLIGWRAGLEETEYENFITSWLVHIIAVSGSNIMMVVLLLGFLLFRVPFYLRIIFIGVTIIAYSIVAWLDSSVMRALVMGCTMLLALLVWRRISIRRSIWYACIILLIINPWTLLYDLGFMLSFCALIWILLFDRRVTSLWVQSRLAKYCIPSIGAALWTLPVLIVVMGSINILSPLINILIVPFVPALLLLWLLWVVIWWHVVTLVERMADSLFLVAHRGTQHALILEVSGLLSKIVFISTMVTLFFMFYMISGTFIKIQERSVNG